MTRSLIILCLVALFLPVQYAVAQVTVEVTSPNGGEELIGGTEITITWNANSPDGIDETEVRFSSDNGANWVVAGATDGNDFDLDYVLPDVFSEECLVEVEVTDSVSAVGTDESDAVFTVSPLPELEVTTPNGGGHYIEQDVPEVTWTVLGGPNTDYSILSLSEDDGANWTLIDTVWGNDYDYDWAIPDVFSFDCRLKVFTMDEYESTGYDSSDAVFTITPIPDVNITYPDGGEEFHADSAITVTWDVTGGPTTDSCEVHYSINGGTDWVKIGSTQDNDYDHAWTIPDTFSVYTLIRVTATDEYGTVGVGGSSAYFAVGPHTRTTTFYKPWAQLCIPLHPNDDDIEDLFGQHMTDTWDFFGFNMQQSYHRPQDLDAGFGYLLTMYQDSVVITDDGSCPFDTLTVALDLGWNLVADPFPG